MTTSALLRHGPGHVTALLDGLTAWMDRKGIGSVNEIRGLLAPAPDTPQPGFGRYGYLHAVEQATRAYSPW
jgi:dihydroorotate dehydrogenase (fumarate)